jgi:hypothetical protein
MGYLTATESLATLNITTCKRHIYHMKQNWNWEYTIVIWSMLQGER